MINIIPSWVALFSAVLCVVLMFMLTWTYAAATVVCQIVLGAYIYYRLQIIGEILIFVTSFMSGY